MRQSDKPSTLAHPEPLARYLAPIDVWGIAFGCIVGWGAFVMPGSTFLPIAGPLGTVLSILIGAAVMLIIGGNYVYLMNRYPGTGGVYTYTKQAFGRDHAFLCSWFLSLSYLSIVFLNATALFVISRTLFGDALQFGFHYEVEGYEIHFGELLVSSAALLLIGLLFVFRKPLLQYVQTGSALVLFVGAAALFILALPHMRPQDIFDFTVGEDFNQLAAVLTLVLLAPWAFVGFDVASLETSHFRFARKKSARIIPLSILCGAFVYIAMTLISVCFRPEGFATWQDYIAGLGSLSGVDGNTTFFAAKSMLGTAGLAIIGVTALAAILTGIIGAYRATTRMLSTMAEDRILSRRFATTSFCIVFIMVISILISGLGRNAMDWFVEMTSFCAVVGFGYASASAFKLAREEQNRRVQISGLIGLAVSVIFGLVLLISKIATVETLSAPSFLLMALWCLVGFFFYWRTMRRSKLTDYHGFSVSGTVLFCLLFYASLMWYAKSLMEEVGAPDFSGVIIRHSMVLLLVVGAGLAMMLFVQNQLRKRQQTLEREIIRAEESSKAKSHFLFNMSHDIRTPMNAIIGYAHLASQEEDVPPRIRDYIEKIDVSGKHLLALINDVLEMGQIESGKLELLEEPNDLIETVRTACEMFRIQMEEKRLTFTLDDHEARDGWTVFDRNRFLRVLLNLLSNAYKFTPEGGSVTVTLRQTACDLPERAAYELTVADTGIGMTAEFAENVFEMFARERTSTVSRTQGTGLGMAITKSIIETMGGTIDVKTAPDEGTAFTLRFTLALAAPPEEQPEDAAAPLELSRLRLLLAEDSEINREIAQMILTQSGCQVETAENGREAVDMVAASAAGYYDAVLMDIQMPVMDGFAATRAIRALPDEQLRRIPIIAITANAFHEDVSAVKEAGMQGHIAKPLDVDKMLQTLSTVLRGTEETIT